MRRLHWHVGTLIGLVVVLVGGFALWSAPASAQFPARLSGDSRALAPPPPAAKGDGNQSYPATPLDQTIPGSPLRVVVRPSGSYAVYRNNIQQFFGQYAEGVYLWVNNQVWGPELVPAGQAVNMYTQISSVLSGTGSAADPWVVTNVLNVGTTGLQLTQRVSYVNGNEFIRNDWTLCNTSNINYTDLHLFHAADLWTDGSDFGYGYYDASSGGIGGYNQAHTLYQIFIPISRPARYEEDGYGTIWGDIGSTAGRGGGFRNFYRPNDYIDNGAGLEWQFDLGPICVTYSGYVSFSGIPLIPSATPTPTDTPNATATATPAATATVTDTPTPCVMAFTDVDPYNPFATYIRCLYCHGIVEGYVDNTFRPYNRVTRSQVAKIIANSAGYTDVPSVQTFSDVPSSHIFYLWVERLASRGHITGYPCGSRPDEPCDAQQRPYFRPFNDVTRGQLAKIAANAAGFTDMPPAVMTFPDVPLNDPFWIYIERLARRGIINGYECGSGEINPCTGQVESCDGSRRTYYRPCIAITRGQMVKVAANTFYPVNCAPGDAPIIK